MPIDADGGHPADESGHVLADGAEVPAHALADWLQGVTCARPASNCGLISATQRPPPENRRADQLSGFVDSASKKARAGEVAASVEGVKAVRNNLVVK